MPKACIYAGSRHCFIKWLHFGSTCGRSNGINVYKIFILERYSVIWNDYLPEMKPKIMK